MSEIPTYHDREWLEHEKKVLGLLMLAVQRRALILLTATLNFFDFQTDRLDSVLQESQREFRTPASQCSRPKDTGTSDTRYQALSQARGLVVARLRRLLG